MSSLDGVLRQCSDFSASRVKSLPFMLSNIRLRCQLILGLCWASQDFPKIMSYDMRSTIYGLILSLAFCISKIRETELCLIGTNVPSQSFALRSTV